MYRCGMHWYIVQWWCLLAGILALGQNILLGVDILVNVMLHSLPITAFRDCGCLISAKMVVEIWVDMKRLQDIWQVTY